MDTATTVSCPRCDAPLDRSDESCVGCARTAAAVPARPVPNRAPLILPGDPALSADPVGNGRSAQRFLAPAIALVVIAVGAFWFRGPTSATDAAAPLQVSSLTITESLDSVVRAQQVIAVDSNSSTTLPQPLPLSDTVVAVSPPPLADQVPATEPPPTVVRETPTRPAPAAVPRPTIAQPPPPGREPPPKRPDRAADPNRPVMAVEAEALETRMESARSLSRAPAPERGAPAVPRLADVSPPPAVAAAPQERESALDAGEIAGAMDRVVAQIRSGAAPAFEVREFLSSGDGHRVSVAGAPSTDGTALGGVRVAFTVRLTKYDAAGRPVTRLAPVTMELDKRASEVRTSSVAVGALRKP